MAGFVTKLMAVLGLDTREFQRGIDGAKSQAPKFDAAWKAATTAVAGYFTVGAVARAFNDYKRQLVEIADVSQDLGISGEALQTLQLRATDFRVDNERLVKSLERLKQAQSEIGDNPKMQEAFAALGVSWERVAELDPVTLLSQMGAGLKEGGADLEQFNALSEIFGAKIGPKMVSFLQDIAGTSLQPLIDEYTRLGAIVDETTIKQADSFDTMLKRAEMVSKAVAVNASTDAKKKENWWKALFPWLPGAEMAWKEGKALWGSNQEPKAKPSAESPFVGPLQPSTEDRKEAAKKLQAESDAILSEMLPNRQTYMEGLDWMGEQKWGKRDRAGDDMAERFKELGAKRNKLERELAAVLTGKGMSMSGASSDSYASIGGMIGMVRGAGADRQLQIFTEVQRIREKLEQIAEED